MLLLVALLQPPQAVPFDTPAAPDVATIRAKAERLPDPPKLDPANVHLPGPVSGRFPGDSSMDEAESYPTQLRAAVGGGLIAHRLVEPQTTRLLVELAPRPGGGRQVVRVLVAAEVVKRSGYLEMLLTNSRHKWHESVLHASIDPAVLHQVLEVAGGKPGTPVQFVNPKTGEEDYKPATGTAIEVTVHYRKDGKLHTHPGQEWVRHAEKKTPLAPGWVFAGSRRLENPDRPDQPPFYTARGGQVVSVSNFGDSLLDVPQPISADNGNLSYEATTERIPPLLSGVWVILTPAAPSSPKR